MLFFKIATWWQTLTRNSFQEIISNIFFFFTCVKVQSLKKSHLGQAHILLIFMSRHLKIGFHILKELLFGIR